VTPHPLPLSIRRGGPEGRGPAVPPCPAFS